MRASDTALKSFDWYFSPESQRMVTTVCPAPALSRITHRAAILMPEERPRNKPSSRKS